MESSKYETAGSAGARRFRVLSKEPATYFASALRASADAVRAARQKLLTDSSLVKVVDAIPDCVALLNEHRQILVANRRILDLVKPQDPDSLVGLRPGEALNCIRVNDGPAGCGTGPACCQCGAANALVAIQQTADSVEQECRITSELNGGTPLELHVVATPFDMNGLRVTMLVLKDVSAEKRRNVLERVFFHDVVNTVSGLAGLAEAVASGELSAGEEGDSISTIARLAGQLQEEIQQYRRLVMAERGEFVPDVADVDVPSLLADLCSVYAKHPAAQNRYLRLGNVPAVQVRSDAALLCRILGNFITNALEASPACGVICLLCEDAGDSVRFLVKNAGVIPHAVQQQMFQRSFSTKGSPGRGIGLYSAKLFGEKYLQGRIAFTSREPDGTTFQLAIPKAF